MMAWMKRGEVWWVDFAPAIGGEIQKTRPAVIVSNNAANQFSNRVQVIPLSTKTSKLYPSDAKITVGEQESKAMADQIRTVAKQRLGTCIGELSPNDMRKVELAIRIQLGLAV